MPSFCRGTLPDVRGCRQIPRQRLAAKDRRRREPLLIGLVQPLHAQSQEGLKGDWLLISYRQIRLICL